MSFADDDIAEVLIDHARIAARVSELGAEIGRDYAGLRPLMLGVLTGSFVFMADLVRAIGIPLEVEFCGASSYGLQMESAGEVALVTDVCADVTGRDVVLVEDIVDTGRTLAMLMELIRERGAASVEICALLSKPARRVVELEPRYLGFEIPDHFVVGYGLDFAHQYRHLPFVAVLKPEAYRS